MEHFPFLQLSVTRLRELKATLTKFSRCPGEPAEMQLLAQEVSGGASDPRKPLRCGCCWLRGPPWNNKRVQDVTEATQLGVTGFINQGLPAVRAHLLFTAPSEQSFCVHTSACVTRADLGRLGGRPGTPASWPQGCWGPLIPRGHRLPSNFPTPWLILCSVQADGCFRLCFSPGWLNPEGLTPKFSFHANHRGLCENADFPVQ